MPSVAPAAMHDTAVKEGNKTREDVWKWLLQLMRALGPQEAVSFAWRARGGTGSAAAGVPAAAGGHAAQVPSALLAAALRTFGADTYSGVRCARVPTCTAPPAPPPRRGSSQQGLA